MTDLTHNVITPDQDGYLRSTIKIEAIQSEWLAAAKDYVEYFSTFKDENVHSIYLRGSVASGTAVKNISDIDFYVVTIKPVTEFNATKLKEYTDTLHAKYPFITKFDTGYYIKDQVVHQKEGFLLKLTSMCIFGPDISEEITNPRPGNDMALTIPFLASDIVKLKSEIDTGFYVDPVKAKQMCIWICKRVIRSSFELISEQEACFTRDLQACRDIFLKYHPSKQTEIDEAIDLFLSPTADAHQISLMLDGVGVWLVAAYEQKNHPS